MDLFNETIMCKDCGKKMSKTTSIKNGFKIRTLHCSKCKKRLYHPADIERYKRFLKLKQQPFNVKLRVVGNSYTVSIPREIINFQEKMHQEMKKQMEDMNKFVRLCLEGPKRISLLFGEDIEEE